MSISFRASGALIVRGFEYQDDELLKLLEWPGRIAYDEWHVAGDLTKTCEDFCIILEYTVDNEDGDPAWKDHFQCYCPNVMIDRIRELQADYVK